LCSHLLSEVERVADRVLILVDGRAAAVERLDALRERQVAATRLLVRVPGELDRARGVLEVLGIGSVTQGESRCASRPTTAGDDGARIAARGRRRRALVRSRAADARRAVPRRREAGAVMRRYGMLLAVVIALGALLARVGTHRDAAVAAGAAPHAVAWRAPARAHRVRGPDARARIGRRRNPRRAEHR
jgi:hypothetical protein